MNRAEIYSKALLQSVQDITDRDTSISSEEIKARAKNFLAVLGRRGEQHLLPGILRHLESVLARREETTVVTSRFALDPETKRMIYGFLQSKWREIREEITYHTNPRLLGGVMVRHKDFLFDATLNATLLKLKRAWA